MAKFTGTLNHNEIIGVLFNMIISQDVLANNIKGNVSDLANKYRVDGTLYGDTKLFYATDALESYEWTNYDEASKLLETNKPKDPECQAITIDKFRQIFVTTDTYLTKRAFVDEGTFGDFKSVTLGWIRDTKKVYEGTLVNTYIGTVVTNADINELTTTNNGQAIAQDIADLFTDLEDVSRDYNDYGFLRAYDMSDFDIIWNASYVNKVKNIDLPVIFHNDELKEVFAGKRLQSRYFGDVLTSAGTAPESNSNVRTLIEGDFTGTDKVKKHLFPGDLIPAGAAYKANEAYAENAKIVAKIVHKNAIKYMSAFEVATTFVNGRALLDNNYLTWGFSQPQYLYNYPVITVKVE